MANESGRTRGWQGSAWRKAMWSGAAAVLALPLVAMHLDAPGVHWTARDFIAMAALLGAAGGAMELGMRVSTNPAYRAGTVVMVGGAWLLAWTNLAVGLIGSEANPANLLYAGVLLTGIVGAVLARLRARGLVRTLLAMAAVQVLVPLFALWRNGTAPATPPVALAGVTLFFVSAWLLAAALFVRADDHHAGTRDAGR